MKKEDDDRSKKIEPFKITEEMASDDWMDEMLREQLIKGADGIEEELESKEELKDIVAPEGMFDEIVAKLKSQGLWEEDEEQEKKEGYEGLSEKDQEALRIGREIQRKREEREKRRIKWNWRKGRVAIAVLVLVCVGGMSVSSEAGKGYFKKVWTFISGGELSINIRGNESNIRSLSEEEEEMNRRVQEELDIIPVKLLYIPDSMVFEYYTVNSIIHSCIAMYEINGVNLSIQMYKDIDGDSNVQKYDGKVLKNVTIQAEMLEVPVWEIENQDNENLYTTQFEFGGGYYTISGVIDEEEFTKIIQNIKF